MSTDDVSPEDQAAINEVARSVMQQLAAGRSAEDVARDLQTNGWQRSTADALVEHIRQDWRQIEAAPQANAGLYLQMKYPEMKPVGAAPRCFNVHGIGTGFYGSRDLDHATESYVKTQCFCIMFVPLLALKSYRVTSRGAGWNLIGRVPLSRFAKTWNILFLCAVLASIGLGILGEYLNSATYLAGRKLAQADEEAAAGRLLEASRLYREVAHTRTEHAATARQHCAELVERPEIESLPLREVTQIFDQVLQSRLPGGTLPAVLARGLAIVKSHARADPTASIALLAVSHDSPVPTPARPSKSLPRVPLPPCRPPKPLLYSARRSLSLKRTIKRRAWWTSGSSSAGGWPQRICLLRWTCLRFSRRWAIGPP